MRIALVNTNRMIPPIAPIGLEYVAEAVRAAGHAVDVLDLCFADDWQAAVRNLFARADYGLIGLSFRNTDDCAFTNRTCFIPLLRDMAGAIADASDAPLIMGGVGFSVMPETVLAACSADAGVWGEGEFVFPDLAARLEQHAPWEDLAGLVVRKNNTWVRNPAAFGDLAGLPEMTRSWVDNPRYFREGGQIGFETKRGCSGACIYCADPAAKGNRVRVRPSAAVADEIENLLAQGIDGLHTCDSEFNLPADHAAAVCREFIRRDLGRKLTWYAYCAPQPFDADLANLMRRAGCVGINFGTDSGDAGMLRRLGRTYGPAAITAAAQACHAAGIRIMFDLLLGAPGESAASIMNTIELMKACDPHVAGVTVGLRIYPGTPLAAQAAEGTLGPGLVRGEGEDAPLFFLEPAVADTVYAQIDSLVAGDDRFLFFDPTRPALNYNYSANTRLADAIRNGARGAYWDILRQAR